MMGSLALLPVACSSCMFLTHQETVGNDINFFSCASCTSWTSALHHYCLTGNIRCASNLLLAIRSCCLEMYYLTLGAQFWVYCSRRHQQSGRLCKCRLILHTSASTCTLVFRCCRYVRMCRECQHERKHLSSPMRLATCS